MIGTLKRIVAYDKQRKPSFLSQVRLSADKGIPGDRHRDDDRDPISVWFYPPDIGALGSWPPPEQRKGLCTVKFRANLMVEPAADGQIMPNLKVGDPIRVGRCCSCHPQQKTVKKLFCVFVAFFFFYLFDCQR